MQAKLDNLDLKILELLQKDGSMSVAEIAERIGLTQPPCWRRIKRLEKDKIIEGRVNILNAQNLGFNVTIFTRVKLSTHGRQSLPEFEKTINSFPEVLECYTMLGEYDYLLKIVTRDIDAYETFFRQHLSQMPGVSETHSNVALSEIKSTTELPLKYIELNE